MADNLIFPIGFDLEKAVNEAGQQWDKKYAKKLEDYMAKRPVRVKLDFDKLEDVKRRLAQLKIEPITHETRSAIKELAKELQQLAKALEQVQKYSKTTQLGQRNFSNDVQLERLRQANERLEIQKRRVALAEQKHAEALQQTTKASHEASAALQTQDSYLSRLIKRTLAYASFNAISTFLTRVREVTAQFELQRVSLGAIIQDQNRANQLFSEIKSFALKSPVSILDLTKYTKQLAAYKFETEELFDWTKRLTDISVGLGVSMDRIVLMAGQIRATGHLRASEVRQATEAGIPLVEELAAKLSKMNGEMVTSAQVMDLISKRAISWDLVKEVFDDMTSAGGMFYQMQEKQGNTLFGLWAKLGDAASVMYEEIGNTENVNKGMKAAIQLLTELMRDWKQVGQAIGIGVGTLALGKTINLFKGWQSNIDKAKIAANEQYIASSNAYRAAINAEQAARTTATSEEYRAIAAKTASAEVTYNAARAEYLAARNTTIWSKAWGKLKAAFLGNWITLLIAGLAAIGMAIYNAHEKANRLKNTLKDIAEESGIEQMKSVRNFESLANIAVQAADGSKKQKDALDELLRTYKDIIPQERLTIENLREMKGNYDSLTQSIKDYVAQQMKQKQINAVLEITGREMIEKTRDIQDIMKDTWNYEQIARFMNTYERIIRNNPAISNAKAMKEAAEEAGIGWQNMLNLGAITRDKLAASLRGYAKALKEQINQTNALDSAWNNNYIALGKYGNEYENLINKIKENPIEMGGSSAISEDKTPYLFKQQQQNLEILKAIIPTLQKIMSDAGVVWQDGWANIVSAIDVAQPQIISSIDFKAINNYLKDNLDLLTDEQRKAVEKLQALYGEIGITDEVVRYNRKLAIDLANSMEESLSKIGDGSKTALDNVTKYFMTSGQSVNDYAKTLDDALKNLKERIAELEAIGLLMSPEARKELEDLKTAAEYVEKLRSLISSAVTSDDGGHTTTSDPRLQNLKEEISLVQKLYNEYKQLEKQEGTSKAAADMRRMAGGTLDMFKEKYNIGLPTDAKDLTAALEILYKKMAALPKKVFPSLDKDLKELRWTIEKVDIDESQKNIEAELKRLADRISRTKTAKEFYEKILSQTGDVELAARVSLSIYGSTGEELFKDTVKQIKEVFKTGNKELDETIEMQLDYSIDTKNERINYQYLAEIYDYYQDQIIEKNRSTAENIVKEGQKTAASNIATWEKELAKAKDYEEQRTDIINRETQRRAEIYKSNLPQEEKDRLAAQSQKKQDEDLAKVNFDEFTKSEDYIKIFENLDNVATSSLKRLRAEMQALIDTNQNLSPENMKTLVKAMEDIDEQISGRGFGNDMVQSVNDYIASIKNLKIAKQELTAAEAEYQAQLPQFDEDIATAENERVEAQRVLNNLKNDEFATENQIVTAELRLNTATANVAKAQQAKTKAADKVKKAEQKVTGEQDKQKKATTKFVKDLQKVASTADQLASGLSEVKDLLGISEDSAAGLVFDSAISSLQQMSTAIGIATTAQALFNAIAESNPYIAVAAGVLAVGSAIASWISGSKVRKANKEIERQQELLEQLEYTYGRLEKAADKAFGTDYVNNYQQQIKNLQAQQQAYLKQAEAERSKGKKKDKDKIKEYEEQARETADAIKELQDDLVAHFTGSSRTDVARQMAKSWIDARASMSDTFAAIKEDYAEMIKNMIVEGAAARVIENALAPMWDSMEKMLAKNDVEGAIDSLVNGMDAALTQANNGMEVLWKALEARGYDMKQLIGDVDSEYTGIAKNIAGATSEEINTAAAIGNTIMYHTSHLPIISQNVAAMYQLMLQSKTSALPDSGAAGWTDWQHQAMENYNAIARNTAETVVECRRAAVACEAATEKLDRALRTKGATSGFNVFLNS